MYIKIFPDLICVKKYLRNFVESHRKMKSIKTFILTDHKRKKKEYLVLVTVVRTLSLDLFQKHMVFNLI